MENKVLIDSSCWVDFFRQSNPTLTQLMGSLLRQRRVLMCGPVHFEIVGGARIQSESNKISSFFQELDYLDLERQDFHESSLLRQKISEKGITIHGMDLLIAYLAIKNNCYLLHRDSDYDHIAKHVHLKILKK